MWPTPASYMLDKHVQHREKRRRLDYGTVDAK